MPLRTDRADRYFTPIDESVDFEMSCVIRRTAEAARPDRLDPIPERREWDEVGTSGPVMPAVATGVEHTRILSQRSR